MIARMEKRPSTLEDKILEALGDGIKSFGQLELACGGLDPANAARVEAWSKELDVALQGLLSSGKVRLVARRPTLFFELGTALDEMLKALEDDDA